jgi:NAD(P)H-dependent FMN reductase
LRKYEEFSTNLSLIKAIANISDAYFSITIFNGLDMLPHFNPDLDIEPAPQTIIDFRKQLKEADGILICTPEYAMGVPGTLKNAIDWTVSSCEFSHKPVALITASSVGQKGHTALLETLQVIECAITDETQLLISFSKTKINDKGQITDPETLEKVKQLIQAFIKILILLMNEKSN